MRIECTASELHERIDQEWEKGDIKETMDDWWVVTKGVELSSTDLRDNHTFSEDVQTATVQVADADGSVDGPWLCGEALYLPSAGRIGIAWGADAVWADAESLDDGIRMYMVDPEEFEARN
jgi:hypothetical protein